MRSLLPISVSLLLWSGQAARAQPALAGDFFNSGAQLYISNNIPSALEKVEGGLKIYPDDQKLKKLEELLKQQQQQQSQQNQQQQKSQQNSPAPRKPEGQKQNQAGQKKDGQPKQPEQQKSSGEKKDGEKPEKQDAGGQPVAPGQMTPEEAKRLLDAQKGDEQLLQLKPPGKPPDPRQPVKDW